MSKNIPQTAKHWAKLSNLTTEPCRCQIAGMALIDVWMLKMNHRIKLLLGCIKRSQPNMIVLLLNRNAAMRMKQSKIPIYQFILDQWYRTFCLIKVTKLNTLIIFFLLQNWHFWKPKKNNNSPSFEVLEYKKLFAESEMGDINLRSGFS